MVRAVSNGCNTSHSRRRHVVTVLPDKRLSRHMGSMVGRVVPSYHRTGLPNLDVPPENPISPALGLPGCKITTPLVAVTESDKSTLIDYLQQRLSTAFKADTDNSENHHLKSALTDCGEELGIFPDHRTMLDAADGRG